MESVQHQLQLEYGSIVHVPAGVMVQTAAPVSVKRSRIITLRICGIMEIIAAIMEAIATIIIFIAGDVILASVFTPFPVLVGVSGILGVIYSCKTHLNQLNIAHMVFAILSTIASGFYFLYVVVFAISSEGTPELLFAFGFASFFGLTFATTLMSSVFCCLTNSCCISRRHGGLQMRTVPEHNDGAHIMDNQY